MKRLTKLASTTAITGALIFGGTTAANASPYALPEYCSPSIGCVGKDSAGDNIYSQIGPRLTSEEMRLYNQCGFALVAAGVGFFGNVAGMIAGGFGIAGVMIGPCQDLAESTTRFRS